MCLFSACKSRKSKTPCHTFAKILDLIHYGRPPLNGAKENQLASPWSKKTFTRTLFLVSHGFTELKDIARIAPRWCGGSFLAARAQNRARRQASFVRVSTSCLSKGFTFAKPSAFMTSASHPL